MRAAFLLSAMFKRALTLCPSVAGRVKQTKNVKCRYFNVRRASPPSSVSSWGVNGSSCAQQPKQKAMYQCGPSSHNLVNFFSSSSQSQSPSLRDVPPNLNLDEGSLELFKKGQVEEPRPPPLIEGDSAKLSSVRKAVSMLRKYNVTPDDLTLESDEVPRVSQLTVRSFCESSPEATDHPLSYFPLLESGGVRVDLLHRVFVHQRNVKRGRRTAMSKTYNAKSGSGRKPHPQKGTGRARMGNIRRPGNVGGIKAHGPKGMIQDYGNTKVNAKLFSAASIIALRTRLKSGNIVVVEAFDGDKTAYVEEGVLGLFGEETFKGKGLPPGGKTLLLMGDVESPEDVEKKDNFIRATRNIFHVHCLKATAVNTWDVIRNERVVFDRKGWEDLVESRSDI